MSEVLRAKVMHLDGTSLPVLDDKSPGNIKLGSIWGYVGVDGDVQRALCLYNSMSPPARKGTTSTGITGDQGPTR